MDRVRRQLGFTLMELMIVVAILAIIVAIAIPVFSRWKRRAVRAEVASVLGEISLKEEAFRGEFSAYKECGSGEQWWPALNSGGEPIKKHWGANACWASLGLRLDPDLYCAYSIYAGAANSWGSVPTADKAAFGSSGTAPTMAWYLGVAECDLDGTADGKGSNSIFYRTPQSSGLGERNPDK
jgi:prepilin-type N-terminal cleavage/methylation domain-containing protein